MPEGNGWQVLVDRTLLYAEHGQRLYSAPGRRTLLETTALDHPLRSIYAKFPSDPFSRSRPLDLSRSANRQTANLGVSCHLYRFANEAGSPHPPNLSGIAGTLRRTGLRLAGECFSHGGSSRRGQPRANSVSASWSFRAKNLLATAAAIASAEFDLKALAYASTAVAREGFVPCPEWDGRWQTASYCLPTSALMSFRWIFGLHECFTRCIALRFTHRIGGVFQSSVRTVCRLHPAIPLPPCTDEQDAADMSSLLPGARMTGGKPCSARCPRSCSTFSLLDP